MLVEIERMHCMTHRQIQRLLIFKKLLRLSKLSLFNRNELFISSYNGSTLECFMIDNVLL